MHCLCSELNPRKRWSKYCFAGGIHVGSFEGKCIIFWQRDARSSSDEPRKNSILIHHKKCEEWCLDHKRLSDNLNWCPLSIPTTEELIP